MKISWVRKIPWSLRPCEFESRWGHKRKKLTIKIFLIFIDFSMELKLFKVEI